MEVEAGFLVGLTGMEEARHSTFVALCLNASTAFQDIRSEVADLLGEVLFIDHVKSSQELGEPRVFRSEALDQMINHLLSMWATQELD